MAECVDELMLLERVFLRLGSAQTDEQLQNVLCKFLPPVLLKLSSQQEGVRKKVMELLIHVNKRIKTSPLVQLPVEALLTQYQDPMATSFVTNFTIIYIKSGFPRLSIDKQAELVPALLNALEDKPVSHLDNLLMLIVPVLGKIKVPTDPVKRSSLFGLNEKQRICKHFLNLLLDMLLLPYSALNLQQTDENPSNVSLPVPPCMSSESYKRIISNCSMKPEELEEIKLGIVKFLSQGIFNDKDILIHLIVAASDTRFSIANIADSELKKILPSIDWGSIQVTLPLFNLFLGSQGRNLKPEEKKSPANTRIRLKLLTYLCRIVCDGFVFPQCIQIVFDSLYGVNTNSKLKTLALDFTSNIIRHANVDPLSKVAPVLLSGLQKLIKEGDEIHHGICYVLIGNLAKRFPKVVYHDVGLLELFFSALENAKPDVRLQIREGLINLVSAYKFDLFPDEYDKDGRLNILFALVKLKVQCEESMVRFAAVHTIATIFPLDHIPSKFYLLMATGDSKEDVSATAFKALYGTTKNNSGNIDLERKNEFKLSTPPFEVITNYIYKEIERMKDNSKESKTPISLSLPVYTEIVTYLRMCLLKEIDVPHGRSLLKHPCEYSPKIGALLRKKHQEKRTSLMNYIDLVKDLLILNSGLEATLFAIELIGCMPDLYINFNDNLQKIKEQMFSSNAEMREHSSLLYGLMTVHKNKDEYESVIDELLTHVNGKSLEKQHGALMALGCCLENYIETKCDDVDWNLVKRVLKVLAYHLKSNQNVLLINAACASIGNLARVHSLPLDDGHPSKTGSPDPKKPAKDEVTKLDVVNLLLDVMNNVKLPAKTREKSAKALGLLCVGERFVYWKDIAQGFLNTSKETKDVEVHFTIGESLQMCCQSVNSPLARNFWTKTPEDGVECDEEIVGWLLDEVLNIANQPHPNSKQSACIWLLSIVKGCGKVDSIGERLPKLQNTFLILLCDNNDIVQDAASKGICALYEMYKSEELMAALVKQLTSGTRQVSQVTDDTKLFEVGQLGTAPTGGNLTTYKELCSLASDLNKPDLIYQFMQLANHNAVWNSKKGAAFGFSSLAEKCGEHLKNYLPEIVPKLYRYQYDPSPNIQSSMRNIWKVLVADQQKSLDEYYDAILADLLDNLNSNQYRVRQSCCLALQDFLKGSNNRNIFDAINSMNDLWLKLFRVMDDHHEETRLVAQRTVRILSKLCIRGCDTNHGKNSTKMVEAVLPPLLNVGITSNVTEIRLISLQTVSELVSTSGEQLKPFLSKLIPALLQATDELESVKLSYLSTMLGAQSQAQEAVDSVRASFAKSHVITDTVSKSLQYADASILEELVPKVIDLMKNSVGLASRIASAHFITLLVVQLGKEVQPYTGKFLAVLVNGLTDRNAAIRKHYATSIGYLVSTAKESSLEKLFEKLQHWYFEREDDSIRSACAQTIQSIGVHNQEILKTHSDVVLPLVFFAMHAEKTPEMEKTLEIWNEIWSEQSPGPEMGIKQNLKRICEILQTALESPSWTMKAQAANTISTVASKLKARIDPAQCNLLINVLLKGLNGRTWKGKENLLKALANICSNCGNVVKEDPELDESTIAETVLKEIKKENVEYKTEALKSLGEILSSLNLNKFDEVYSIAQDVLTDVKNDEDNPKSVEQQIKLKEIMFETLGKAWPENCALTQDKYKNIFVKQAVECLPKETRSVQVSVLTALYSYVNKLILLNKEDGLRGEEVESLRQIIEDVLKAVGYAMNVSRHTKLRKESLNIILCLAGKLREKNDRKDELDLVKAMFEDVLVNVVNDVQPEIKSRVYDIKKLLN